MMANDKSLLYYDRLKKLADDIGTYVSADIIGWYSHLRKKRHLANISVWKYNMRQE